MKDYLRPRTAFETIRDAVEIYAQNFVPFLAAFSLTLPVAFLRDYVATKDDTMSPRYEYLIDTGAFSLYQLFSTFVILMVFTVMVSMVCLRNKPSLRLALKWISERLLVKLFSTYAVILVTLWGGSYLAQWLVRDPNASALRWVMALAVVLFLLAFYAVSMFVPCVVILEEGVGGVAAFARSSFLGRGFYLRNLLLVLAADALTLLVYLVLLLAQLFPPIERVIPDGLEMIGFLENSGMLLVAPLSSICTVLLYHEMRVRKEPDWGLEALQEELFS